MKTMILALTFGATVALTGCPTERAESTRPTEQAAEQENAPTKEGAQPTKAERPSEETMEQLKSLGYVQ